MPLRTRAVSAFDAAIERAGTFDELSRLREVLADARDHLDEPMRLAVVGHVKAGKSTMLNALLGEELAPTGTEELTFNVNWLRHGPRPLIRVHFDDGRPPEDHALADLERLSSRNEEDVELLSRIDYLEVHHPSEILRSFDLIDTPGLKSFFGKDSLNTQRALGRSPEELEERTRKEAALADALLCLFSRSLAAADHSVVEDFQGPLLSTATPINAIGVLTKVDAYWDPRDPMADPLEEGRKVAMEIASQPAANRVFYAVRAVCGLLAFGARTLDGQDVDDLRTLARVADDRLTRMLRYAERFVAHEDAELGVPPERRRALVERRLGQYGIWLAAGLLRSGATEDELRDELWRRSGVAELHELIVSHFGRRAFLIKAQTGLRDGRTEARRARQSHNGDVARASAQAAGALEALETGEPAFEELGLLRSYYEDGERLGLRDGEADELLRITGERGTSIGPRLGLPEQAPVDEMVATAERRLAYWQARRDGFGADAQTMATSRVLAGAYQRILFHAREARRHLELDQ